MVKLKISEARILVFLKQVPKPERFARNISTKLDMDYGYGIRILKAMVEKGWLSTHRLDNKVFYNTESKAMLTKAKEEISK